MSSPKSSLSSAFILHKNNLNMLQCMKACSRNKSTPLGLLQVTMQAQMTNSITAVGTVCRSIQAILNSLLMILLMGSCNELLGKIHPELVGSCKRILGEAPTGSS